MILLQTVYFSFQEVFFIRNQISAKLENKRGVFPSLVVSAGTKSSFLEAGMLRNGNKCLFYLFSAQPVCEKTIGHLMLMVGLLS
jgi:hypothetical protein